MAVLTIEPDSVPIIKESLEHEIALLKSRLSYIKKEINGFETHYRMSSDTFIHQFNSGALGDDQDFFEWWGFLKGITSVEQKLETARRLLDHC